METRRSGLLETGNVIAATLVVVGSVLYSTKSLFVKDLMAREAAAGDILALRLAWAAPVYLAVIFWNLSRRQAALGDLAKMATLGCLGFWVAPRLNFAGLGSTSASLERILIQSSAAFVILFASLRSRRRPSLAVVLAVAACYAGMAVAMSGRDEGRASADPRGALLIFGASVAWAVFVVGVGDLQKRLGVGLSTSVGMAAAAAPALTETVISGHQEVVVAAPAAWLPSLAGLVAIGTVVPSFLSQAGLARTGPVRSSILSLTGPALLPLMAMATLGESMPWQQVAGLSVVLASCAAMSLRNA